MVELNLKDSLNSEGELTTSVTNWTANLQKDFEHPLFCSEKFFSTKLRKKNPSDMNWKIRYYEGYPKKSHAEATLLYSKTIKWNNL